MIGCITKTVGTMGASSSINGSYRIHISRSTKFVDENDIMKQICEKLMAQGIHVTITDGSISTNEICQTIRDANIVIYCFTQNYGACSTQAIEYSYLTDNKKKKYNLTIDSYENGVFMKYAKELFEGDTWTMSSVQDIPSIIQNINTIKQ
jgi:hypothetical protein